MLKDAARRFVTSGVYGHLVTVEPDGRPQVSLAWFDLDGDELVFGTLANQRKLDNLRREPRTAVSFESDGVGEHGLRPYLVVHGVATVTEGGAPVLLQQLAHRYLGPKVTFPPMPDPPEGFVTRIAVTSVSRVGAWGG